ncbi:MAG: alpha/beta fold hydrolase [Bauldia sp.]|mgnify:CR=1 FL=1
MLDGPRIAARRHPTSVVVFLHGFGADGNDLIDIGRRWSHRLPATAFIAPHAPQARTDAPYGRQWFPLGNLDPAAVVDGLPEATMELDRFLDQEAQRLGISESRIALVGFSQGAMLALHLAPRRRRPLGAVISYSGLLIAPQDLSTAVRSRPPILLVHGSADEVIPAGALRAAADALGAAGLAAEWHLRPGLGHSIDQVALDIGLDFLARQL